MGFVETLFVALLIALLAGDETLLVDDDGRAFGFEAVDGVTFFAVVVLVGFTAVLGAPPVL